MSAPITFSSLVISYQTALKNDGRVPKYRSPQEIIARLQRMGNRISALVEANSHVPSQNGSNFENLATIFGKLNILLERHKPRPGDKVGFSVEFLHKIDNIIDDIEILLVENPARRLDLEVLSVRIQVILNIYIDLVSGPDIGYAHLKDTLKQTLIQNSIYENEKNLILDFLRLLSRLGLDEERQRCIQQVIDPDACGDDIKGLISEIEILLNILKSFREKIVILNALRLLSQLGFNKERQRYIQRMSNPNANREDLRGLIFEMKGLLHITADRDLQILEIKFDIRKKGTDHTMEFFDVIARSKTNNRLIFFEIKGENNYSLVKFMDQFLGIRYRINKFLRKPLCQIDVLLQPDQFIPLNSLSYKNQIEEGEIEIRVLTPTPLRRLERAKIYYKNQTLEELLNALPETALISFSPNSPHRPTTLAIEEALAPRIDEIRKKRPELLNVPIRFEFMQSRKDEAIFRGYPQLVK
jgi:hypothetical protein